MKMQDTSYITNENVPYCRFFGPTSFRLKTNVKNIVKKMNISRLHHFFAVVFTNKKFKCPRADEILSLQRPRC